MTEVVLGLKELNDMLQQFPVRVEKNILRGALRAGANVILGRARQLAPVATGQLRKSIRVSTGGRRGELKAKVTAGGKLAHYAHFVEFGTATYYTGTGKTVGGPYEIKGQTKKAIAFDGVTVHHAMHPGIRPQPFMRPALDEKSREAVEAFRAYIIVRIGKELKK